MERFMELGRDMVLLWENYHGNFFLGSGYLGGIRNTLILAVVATLIGCVIGFVCGVLNTIPCAKNDPPVKRFVIKLIRAIVVVSINTGAYMAESVRGGIISIDPGQTEGAKAIGMTHVQTMTSVILPQAFRNILPQIGNNFIINIKDTSVMFVITFAECFAFHRYLVGVNSKYFPSAAIEMIGYLTMTLMASFLLRWLERRMDGSSSYELVQDDALTMAAGTYRHPDKGTPFDERHLEQTRERQALEAEKRERTRQELKHGRSRGDR